MKRSILGIFGMNLAKPIVPEIAGKFKKTKED